MSAALDSNGMQTQLAGLVAFENFLIFFFFLYQVNDFADAAKCLINCLALSKTSAKKRAFNNIPPVFVAFYKNRQLSPSMLKFRFFHISMISQVTNNATVLTCFSGRDSIEFIRYEAIFLSLLALIHNPRIWLKNLNEQSRTSTLVPLDTLIMARQRLPRRFCTYLTLQDRRSDLKRLMKLIMLPRSSSAALRLPFITRSTKPRSATMRILMRRGTQIISRI